MNTPRFDPAALDVREMARRRHRVLTIVLLLAGPAWLVMADLHWRTGYGGWELLHLLLFALLSVLIALGAAQALIGYFLRRQGGDSCRIVDSLDPSDERELARVRTAIVMPICNEEVDRVIEGVSAIYKSLQATGGLPNCHFFLLSDSTQPNNWIREEAAWLELTRRLDAQGRIFYRKRKVGINKKAGNLADFCRRWGSLYRYMVVLDADSLLTGDAIVRLVRLMERNRGVGIIQGVPKLVNGETILARLQQFAAGFYSPIFVAGLNYWQLGEANYWGHNAIIRLDPFIRHCSLPELPKKGPFGGRILSHDFVEAALMRRAGWEVWLATELEGNFEECPATIAEFARRDRRWMQGNLQHSRLLFARGIRWASRVHFLLGILSYIASPLWLAFMLVSAVLAERVASSGLNLLPVPSFATYIPWSYQGEALCLLGYIGLLLFLPKILALLDIRRRPDDLAAFGGWRRLIPSVIFETALFTLLAPILMLYHSWFVLLSLIGQKVGWAAQRRGAGKSAWTEAVREHGVQTAVGIASTAAAEKISAAFALWMSPVLAGLTLSVPLAYATGSLQLGLAARRHGLLLTPEETRPLPELRQLSAALESRRTLPPPAELAADYGLLQAVLDPFVHAVHTGLLRDKEDQPPGSEQRFIVLRRKLLREGPRALEPRDRMSLLMDADSMHALHRDVWAAPPAELAEWWRKALRHYTRPLPAPQTAFSR